MAVWHTFPASRASMLLFAAALSGCGAGSPGATEARIQAAGPAASGGRIAPLLAGAWRVLGEGTLLEISATGVRQFQQATSMCYPDPAGSSDDPADLAGISFRREFNGSAARVELFELDGAPASQVLERIDAIPASCRAPLPADPSATLRALCEVMSLDYAFFAARNFDWDARCRRLAPRAAAATDAQALQAVLVEALGGIGDAHVKLYRGHGDERVQVFSGSQGATLDMLAQAFGQQSEIADLRSFQLAWREEVLAQMARRLEDDSGEQLGGAMRWGRLPGNVGYIAWHRMLGFSEDGRIASEVALAGAAMDRALAALAGTRAMIVDVSFNGGGSDLVSAEIAARFADQPRLAFTKHWQRAQGRVPQPWTISPKGASRYFKPVYLLTGDLTGSAGETFTLMMRQFPQVRHAGQATMGAISDILERSLPGGFTVTFSNEIVRDPAGRSWEVSGIAPVVPLRLFDPAVPESLLSGHGAAVEGLRLMALE